MSTDNSPAGRSNKVRAAQRARRQFPSIRTSQSKERGIKESHPAVPLTLQHLILIGREMSGRSVPAKVFVLSQALRPVTDVLSVRVCPSFCGVSSIVGTGRPMLATFQQFNMFHQHQSLMLVFVRQQLT